jgi:hypothetical protein
MTFRGLEIWDLGIMTRVGVRKLGEIDGLKSRKEEQSSNGLGPAPAAPAYGPGTEGAGTRVCGYAIKNSGLIVAVDPPAPSCLCERTPCQDPKSSG